MSSLKPLETLRQFDDKHPYMTSIGAGALRFVLGAAITTAGDKVGLSLRHGRHTSSGTTTDTFEKHPILSAVGVSTIAPLGEELFWRHGAALIGEHFPDDSRLKSLMPLGSLALFAAQHAGKDGVPIPQLIGGALYQQRYNKHGLLHSVIAHATNNSIAVASYAMKKRRSTVESESPHPSL
ncbi:MAG: CPBP family intramembrane glutamic endopeptidase [Candidatus Saccharimonadales bacterium]